MDILIDTNIILAVILEEEKSPLDVKGIKTNITREDILDIMSESRRWLFPTDGCL
ncbi:MAG: hypothetical protein LBF01_01715 [Bacteroidales bacterium]|nr:hypothetical protein [Bacteroidales bacterium]